MTTTKFTKTVTELRGLTEKFPYPVYAVGGCVRDLISGIEPHDIDIVVEAPNGERALTQYIKENFPEKIKNVVEAIKFHTNRFDLVLSDGTEEQIDCAMTRAEEYQEGTRKPSHLEYSETQIDALRRDFTVNALYYDIKTNKVLDPTGRGQEDLGNRVLRTPLDPSTTFKEDSLRMMRAIRFKHSKGFSLSEEVISGIKESASFIKTTSRERITEEFTKILLSDTPAEGIIDLHTTGLLKYILPEFDDFWGMKKSNIWYCMGLDSTTHCLDVLRGVTTMKAPLEVRLAALLLDIAPINSPQIDYPESLLIERFPLSYSSSNQELASSDLAEDICLNRFKFSKEVAKKVSFLVKQHLIMRSVWDKRNGTYDGSDALTRMIARTLGENLNDTMTLIEADNMAQIPEERLVGQVEQFLNKLKTLKMADYSAPIVDGKEICQLLSIKPGKAVKLFQRVINLWRDENPDLKKEDLPTLIKSRKYFSQELIDCLDC